MLSYEGVQVSEQKSTNENLVRGFALVWFFLRSREIKSVRQIWPSHS